MISNFHQTNHRLTTNEFLKSRKILIKPLIAGIQEHTKRGIIEIIGLWKGLKVLKQVSDVCVPGVERVKFMILQQRLEFKNHFFHVWFQTRFPLNNETIFLRNVAGNKYSFNFTNSEHEMVGFVLEIWYTFNYDSLKCWKGWELWFLTHCDWRWAKIY